MGRRRKLPEDSQLEILSTRVKPGLYNLILRIAERRDVTVAHLVRHTLRNFVLRQRHTNGKASQNSAN